VGGEDKAWFRADHELGPMILNLTTGESFLRKQPEESRRSYGVDTISEVENLSGTLRSREPVGDAPKSRTCRGRGSMTFSSATTSTMSWMAARGPTPSSATEGGTNRSCTETTLSSVAPGTTGSNLEGETKPYAADQGLTGFPTSRGVTTIRCRRSESLLKAWNSQRPWNRSPRGNRERGRDQGS
jgi:hypothetical protein